MNPDGFQKRRGNPVRRGRNVRTQAVSVTPACGCVRQVMCREGERWAALTQEFFSVKYCEDHLPETVTDSDDSGDPDIELNPDDPVADPEGIKFSDTDPEPVPEPDPAVFQMPAEGLSQRQIRAGADDMDNPGSWRYRLMPVKNRHHTDRQGFPVLGVLEYNRVMRGNYTVFLCDMYTPAEELDSRSRIHFISAEAAAAAGWEID